MFDALFFRKPPPMNIYWCTTADNDEDWFVVAETAAEAAEFHEDAEGYDPGDAQAELVCPIPPEVSAEPGWPTNELLEQLGFEHLEEDGCRVMRYGDRVFEEGNIVMNAAVRLAVEGQEPS